MKICPDLFGYFGDFLSDLHWRAGVVDRQKWFIYFSTFVVWLGRSYLSYFMIRKDIPHVFQHSQVKQRHLSQTISFFPTIFSHTFMIQKHLISSDSSVKELFGRWSLGHQVSMGMLWNTSQEKCVGYRSSMKFYQNGSTLTKVTKEKKAGKQLMDKSSIQNTLAGQKLCLLSSPTAKPFPPRILLSTWFWSFPPLKSFLVYDSGQFPSLKSFLVYDSGQFPSLKSFLVDWI